MFKRPFLISFFMCMLFFGGSWIVLSNRTQDTGPAYTSTTVQPNNSSANLVMSGFNPAANNTKPFEATMNVTAEDGTMFNVLIHFDGKESLRFEGKEDGELLEYYLTPESVVICIDTKCFETEELPDDPLFDVSTYAIAPGELDEIAGQMTFVQETSCGNVVCEEWVSASSQADVTRALIEKDSRQVSTIEGYLENQFVVTSFTYKDVKVVLPLNILKGDIDESLL